MRVLLIITQSTRSIDNTSLPILDEGYHRHEILWIIFTICIMDDSIITAYMLECGANRTSFSSIFLMVKNMDVSMVLLILLENFRRAIF